MFHDDLLGGERRREYHDAYGQMADAVGASLRQFLWALEGVQKAAYEQFKKLPGSYADNTIEKLGMAVKLP